MNQHRVPDGESLIRLDTPPGGREVILVCTLNEPDAKLLPLAFAASAARDLGARRVGLVAPYLAYLRQDRRFHPGEALTSTAFARILSAHFDWLVTVDPHLHRIHALSEIYAIPASAVAAAPAVAEWIRAQVQRPLLVGPDEESAQWVSAIASAAHAPHVVLRKQRHGDRDVTISLPDLGPWREHTPVLADDIISSGRTLSETVRQLRAQNLPPPVCMGIHALFAGDALENLLAAGAGPVVTTNTIAHSSNQIDLSKLVTAQILRCLAKAQT